MLLQMVANLIFLFVLKAVKKIIFVQDDTHGFWQSRKKSRSSEIRYRISQRVTILDVFNARPPKQQEKAKAFFAEGGAGHSLKSGMGPGDDG